MKIVMIWILVLSVLALIPAIAVPKECCKTEYSGALATEDWGIWPSKIELKECCANPQTVYFKIENYSDVLREFDIQGQTIAVEPNSYTRVSKTVEVNSTTRIPVTEIVDEMVKVRFNLKIEKGGDIR